MENRLCWILLPSKRKRITFQELVADLNKEDLARLTNEMIDTMLAQYCRLHGRRCRHGAGRSCRRRHVCRQCRRRPSALDVGPRDRPRHGVERGIGGVSGRAGARRRDARALALRGALGELCKPSAQCRQRLEESRRMRLASLEMWPDQPYLDNKYVPWPKLGEINAVGRFVLGLRHDLGPPGPDRRDCAAGQGSVQPARGVAATCNCCLRHYIFCSGAAVGVQSVQMTLL